MVGSEGSRVKRTESSGLLLALGGFVVLSLGDVLVKSMAGQWSPPAIALTRYAIGAAVLSALLLWREGTGAFRISLPHLQVLRGFAVSLATVSFFAALFVMPLAEATAITFTSPMITALLAAAVLGEPVRKETWLATIVAFAGVLIVLRPNVVVLGWPALLPLLAAVGLSILWVANRAVVGSASPLAMQAFISLMAVPFLATAVLVAHGSGIPALALTVPSWSVLGKVALVAAAGSSAHFLIYLGTTRAGAATIAPMTYAQLLVALVLGWVVFADIPDAMALLGSSLIVGAGVWMWRKTQR